MEMHVNDSMGLEVRNEMVPLKICVTLRSADVDVPLGHVNALMVMHLDVYGSGLLAMVVLHGSVALVKIWNGKISLTKAVHGSVPLP